MNLRELRAVAARTLASHNISAHVYISDSPPSPVPYHITGQAMHCKHADGALTHTIWLSTELAPSERLEILLHELAHVIVFALTGEGGHNEHWMQWARALGVGDPNIEHNLRAEAQRKEPMYA